MAGQASTAGVWPVMSTNVVHMAHSCVVGNGPCSKEPRNSQSYLPVQMSLPQTQATPFASTPTLHNSRQTHLESCRVAALICHR